MDEMVTFLERVHLESPQALRSVPRASQVGHEKATRGYERLTGPGPEFGYTHCVFQYTLSGLGFFSDGRRATKLPPGTGFLCSYQDPSVRYWAAEDSDVTPWEFLYVDFEGGGAQEATRELVERFGPIYRLPPGLPLVAALVALASEPVTTRIATPLETSSLVTNLLGTLCESKTLLALPKTHFLVSEAFELLSRQSDRCFNVSELADALMVSREHLTRLFRETLGRTPRECIIIEKMKQATHLLKTTNLNNDQIAGRLGYKSTERLVGQFKEALGVTPRQYRGSLLAGNDLAHRLFYTLQPDAEGPGGDSPPALPAQREM